MEKKKGIFWGLLAGALWGLDGVLISIYFNGQFVADGFDVLFVTIGVACIHDGLAAVWIFLKNWRSGKVRLYTDIFGSKALKPMIIGSILGGPLGMTGNMLGIQLAGASYASAITATYPVMGAILGMFFLSEKVTILSFGGMLIAVCGAMIVGYIPPENMNPGYFYLGIFCSFLAVVGWAMEGVIATHSMRQIDPDIALGIREAVSFFTYLSILIIAVIFGKDIIFQGLNEQYQWVIVLASVVGAFSYLCYYRSMKYLGVSIAMSLNITYALWAVLFSLILINLKTTLLLVLGVTIITSGTILTILGAKNDDIKLHEKGQNPT